jgi:hypothetical protein
VNAISLLAIVESGLRVGASAAEIARRLCDEHGGYQLPTVQEFDEQTRQLRELPDLTPQKREE